MYPGATGTGLIGVRDDLGAITLSATNLTVQFSVTSFENSTFAPTGLFQPKLVNTNGAGGYDFKYSTSTNGGGADFSTAPEKASFRSRTGYLEQNDRSEFSGEWNHSNQLVGQDAINTIELDNTTKALVYCERAGQNIHQPSGLHQWQQLGDFGYRHCIPALQCFHRTQYCLNNGTCPPASTEVDFESVMLHELGHAHSFGHINDGPSAGNPAKVMNYQVFFNTLRRSPDASSFHGGVVCLANHSELTYGTCVGFPNAEMTPLATSVTSLNDCPGTFPSYAVHQPGLTSIDTRYSTSDKFVDPSTSQIVCSGTSGLYNTVYLPFMTNSTGGDLSTMISGLYHTCRL